MSNGMYPVVNFKFVRKSFLVTRNSYSDVVFALRYKIWWNA